MRIPTVRPGDSITADRFNVMANAINGVVAPSLPGSRIAVQLPWIKNTSGVALEAFQVLELDVPAFPDDADKYKDFRELGSWEGKTPTATGLGKIGVLATDTPAGEWGRLYRGPIVPARVNISHDGLDTCDISAGAYILSSNLAGSARIIWKESTTGADVRCLVQLGQIVDRTYWGVANGDITVGTTTGVVTVNGGVWNVDITNVHLTHSHGGEDISDGRDVRITWFAFDKTWHVVGADCET